MVTVAIAAYAIAGHAKLLSKRNSLMAFGTALGGHGHGRRGGAVIDRQRDVVDAVTVGTYGRARDTASRRLAMDTLHEFGSFGAMTLAAGRGNVGFGN